MVCWSVLLRSLLIFGLITHHAQASDGCDDGGHVRCGEECNHYCICGAGGQTIDFTSDLWCCGGEQCSKSGRYDISCANGTTQPLSQPCEGKCNTGSDEGKGARQYKACEKAQQCIKISEWEDNRTHCFDRSDEKEEQKAGGDDVDWDMKQCYPYGNTNYPGLSCDGVGEGCLAYYNWCNAKYVASCPQLGGMTTLHRPVCNNATFWHSKSCRARGYEGVRCSSAYSGQCYYPGNDLWNFANTCQDGSHHIYPLGSTCPSTKDDPQQECTSSCLTPTPGCKACTNPSSSFLHCKRDGQDVCMAPHLICDLHPNCDEGQDEKGCEHKYKEKNLTPRQGTFPCYSPFYPPGNKITNATVLILAVRCNDDPECWDDADENGCKDKVLDRLELILCAAVVSLLLIMSQALVRKIQKCLRKEPELPMRDMREGD